MKRLGSKPSGGWPWNCGEVDVSAIGENLEDLLDKAFRKFVKETLYPLHHELLRTQDETGTVQPPEQRADNFAEAFRIHQRFHELIKERLCKTP